MKTPRTDQCTYPADCLGKTPVTNADLPRTLERELAAALAALRLCREQLHGYATVFLGDQRDEAALAAADAVLETKS